MTEDQILQMIQQVIQIRKDAGTSPAHATFLELNNLVIAQAAESIYSLRDAGRIRIGDTINDKYIEVL